MQMLIAVMYNRKGYLRPVKNDADSASDVLFDLFGAYPDRIVICDSPAPDDYIVEYPEEVWAPFMDDGRIVNIDMEVGSAMGGPYTEDKETGNVRN